MVYFYALIANGTKQIPKSFHNAFVKLQEYNVLETQGHIHKLKSDFIIGSVDISQSGRFFLKVLKTQIARILYLKKANFINSKRAILSLPKGVNQKTKGKRAK